MEETDDTESFIRQLAALKPVGYGQSRKQAAKKLGIPLGILDKEVSRARRVPSQLNGHASNFLTDEMGSMLGIFTNAAEMLRLHQKEWPLSFDEFSQRVFLGGNPMEDSDLQGIAEWVQRQGVITGRKIIDDAAIYVASQRRFHEVRDWLEKLEWDGIPRIDEMLISHAGAADVPLHRAFMRKWMIQAVARVYEPGCQADATLMLEGGQDIGKSTFFRTLFGDRWFTDHLPSLDNKDAQIQLLGIWCIEISELATTNRSENAKVKQFLTSRDDRFRLPWDRLAKQHPRQSIFGATVNPSGRGHLTDETGGRRWWPVPVTRMDIPAIYDLREQYWAEAVFRYKDSEIWYLGETDLKQAALLVQSQRYISDVWQGEIEDYIENHMHGPFDWIPTGIILTECLGFTKKSDWGQREENRVAKCFAAMNWKRTQHSWGKNKRAWGYQPENTPTDVRVKAILNGSDLIVGFRCTSKEDEVVQEVVQDIVF